MEFLRPSAWEDALAAKAEHPTAVPVAGGTDVMVELNFDHRRPGVLLDLTRIGALYEWDVDGGGLSGGDGRGGAGAGDGGGRGDGGAAVRLGACVPYTRIIDELSAELPGLALAARTVGSPQIRNRGSVGGNLGSASPAGDSHPPLLAAGAEVEAVSVRGTRMIPVEEFFTGVKRHALAEDELIRAVRIRRADGPQQFSKVGTRNAMVIAVCGFGLALHPRTRTVRTGVGSAAPTPLRARAAEDFLNAVLDEDRLWDSGRAVPPSAVLEFGELVAAAASPIDDVRGSARYRRHALAVMARRTFGWAWAEYQENGRDDRCA